MNDSRHIRCWIRWAAVVAGWWVAGAFTSSQAADELLSDEQRMVAGLRSRLLFDLADRYCDERLAQRDRNPADQGNLLIEKIQTQMARAIQSSPDQRAAAWARCQELGDEFLGAQADHPLRLLIRVQQALALLAEARLLGQELAVSGTPADSRSLALDRLRTSRNAFESILRDVGRELPQAPRKRDDSGRLTNLQLQGLQSNLQFQIGDCHLLRATLAESAKLADQVDALSAAEQHFANVLKLADPESRLWYSAQFRRAETARRGGDSAAARSILGAIKIETVPLSLWDDYWEQQLELASAPNEVLAGLSQVAKLSARSPALDLACLKAILRLATTAAVGERKTWLERGAQLTREIETRHGIYWGRLAELTLVAAAGADLTAGTYPELGNPPSPASGAGEIDILIRTGDHAAREGRREDALRAYRQALAAPPAPTAPEAHWQSHLQTRLKVSRLLEQVPVYREAADILLQGVRLQPGHALAPWLHLQAAWCLAQLAPTDSAVAREYRELLSDHLRDYPAAPTASMARLWAARWESSQKNFRLAIELYLAIDPQSEQASAAAPEIQAVVGQHLESIGGSPDRIQSEAQSLAEEIGLRLTAATAGGRVARSSFTQALLATWSTLGIRYGVLDSSEIIDWLTQTLNERLTQEDWRPTGLSLLSAALSEDPQQQGQALETLDQLGSAPSLYHCLELVDALCQRDADARDFRLAVIERLLKLPELNPGEVVELKRRQAAAWEATGEFDRALARLQELAREFPRRLDIQLQLARALIRDPAQTAAALTQWRRVAVGVKDRSEEWYEAKYQVARLLAAQGEREEARKLLDYLSAFPPGWSQSRLKNEFDALRQQLQRP